MSPMQMSSTRGSAGQKRIPEPSQAEVAGPRPILDDAGGALTRLLARGGKLGERHAATS